MKSETITIGGTEFSVCQVPGMPALKLFARYAKHLCPILVGIANSTEQKTGLEGLDLAKLEGPLEKFFCGLHDDEVQVLAEGLLEAGSLVKINGKKIPLWPVVDEVFAGRVFDLLKLIKFALEVNYGDFLGVFTSARAKAAALESSIETSST